MAASGLNTDPSGNRVDGLQALVGEFGPVVQTKTSPLGFDRCCRAKEVKIGRIGKAEGTGLGIIVLYTVL